MDDSDSEFMFRSVVDERSLSHIVDINTHRGPTQSLTNSMV